MSIEKPSLYEEFVKTGDIRSLIFLMENYKYTDEEASKVINIYKPDENGKIPEVEHIEVLLNFFPKAEISDETMSAIKNSFPDAVEYIVKLQKSTFKMFKCSNV